MLLTRDARFQNTNYNHGCGHISHSGICPTILALTLRLDETSHDIKAVSVRLEVNKGSTADA